MEPIGEPSPVSASDIAALTQRVAALERELAALRGEAPAQAHPVPPPPLPAPVVRFFHAEPVTEAAPIPPPPPRPSFESQLGSQIFSRVGIVALLIGVAAFLKLAIDNQWLRPTPMARILAGLIVGAAVILWSERFRSKGFASFSYSLKAVGTGVLYLTLWAGFQLYHLLPANAAFAMMILVTAWNAWMAWAQDAELLAAYALTGAFATPALLASGGNHEAFLFSYVAIINLGVIVLLRFKPWQRLLLGAFPATVVYYFGWYSEWYNSNSFGYGVNRHAPEPLALTAFFIALLFALFASVPIASKFESSLQDVWLPLANTAFTFAALYLILDSPEPRFLLPWLAVLMAGLYLGLMRPRQTTTAAGIHLSMAVVFLTIAIPLKATGRWITIGWLAEGVALLWTSSYLAKGTPASPYKLLRNLALAALLLGFCGLVSLPYWLDSTTTAAFLNARFASALFGLAAFAAVTTIALHAAPEQETEYPIWLTIAATAVIAFNLIALHAVIVELRSYFGANAELQTGLAISAWLMLYGAALLALGFRRRNAFLRWQGLLLVITTIFKTFTWDVRDLSEGYRVASFLGLGALLLAISFAYQKDWLGLRAPSTQETGSERHEAQP